ncbi:phage tail protein [Serratia silvae]|uniref:Phage tail protein n=1 Tax=Serratia silvae TaxID=2824122 RepID=A0ABT0KH67_9GAMM|nr:phage tail protein [Serratia silvae]MCL1031375.1 phage tail protein [Serratia silvae]
MKDNWFKEQLTPAKQNSGLWAGFADVVQSMLSSVVLPLIERTANRKSLYSMGKDDLRKKMMELGKFFYIDNKNIDSLPVLLSQRLDEIHFKGTTRPIEATLWREFKNLTAKWEPLYAPIDQVKYPYGSFFITEQYLELYKESYGEFFLTSRGRINIVLNDLYAPYLDAEPSKVLEEFMRQFKMVIKPLIPLHIVFDGVGYHLNVELEERNIIITLFGVSSDIKSGTWYLQSLQPEIVPESLTIELTATETINNIARPLETTPVFLDDRRLDAWVLDVVPTPMIQTTQPDARLIIADGIATLVTLGYRGCNVEFSTGGITGFVFPEGIDRAILPISAADVGKIKTIIYLDTI